MKRSTITAYIIAVITATAHLTAHSSDPQMFIYRNDTVFNSTHLRSGVNITHSADNGKIHIMDEKGSTTDIPMSAIDSCVLRLTDIPTLHFTLPGYPDAKDIWSKTDYVDAVLKIEGNGYCDDSEELQLSLRGRGNTTWGMPKKPMRMKFPKKISLFGFSKQKNYVLLANYIDDSLMKNAIAFWIARRLGVPYANHTVPVNVEINGVPRGSYLITEKVGINSGSVNIDETKGILFELSTEYDEPYKFRSDIWDLPVMVKDPDFEELAEESPDGPTPDQMLTSWQDDFNEALRQLKAGNGAKTFDMESFARALLLANICVNNELSHPKSFYVHKENLGEEYLYYCGPAWDFDVTFDFHSEQPDGTYVPRSPRCTLYMHEFLRQFPADQTFMDIYKKALRDFADNDLPELESFINEYAAQIEPSAMHDACIWSRSHNEGWFERSPSINVKLRAAELNKWIAERIEFLLERAENSMF